MFYAKFGKIATTINWKIRKSFITGLFTNISLKTIINKDDEIDQRSDGGIIKNCQGLKILIW